MWSCILLKLQASKNIFVSFEVHSIVFIGPSDFWVDLSEPVHSKNDRCTQFRHDMAPDHLCSSRENQNTKLSLLSTKHPKFISKGHTYWLCISGCNFHCLYKCSTYKVLHCTRVNQNRAAVYILYCFG